MSYPTKIATCCFCGSKAALTLDAGRHELACAQCGAPLHDLKRLPLAPAAPQRLPAQPELRQFPKAQPAQPAKPAPKVRMKRPKKKKSWFRKLTSEVIDVVEDIFD